MVAVMVVVVVVNGHHNRFVQLSAVTADMVDGYMCH